MQKWVFFLGQSVEVFFWSFCAPSYFVHKMSKSGKNGLKMANNILKSPKNGENNLLNSPVLAWNGVKMGWFHIKNIGKVGLFWPKIGVFGLKWRFWGKNMQKRGFFLGQSVGVFFWSFFTQVILCTKCLKVAKNGLKMANNILKSP